MWFQFTVWREKWPKQALNDFLPIVQYRVGNRRWHFLYEPYLLIRIEIENAEYAECMFNVFSWNAQQLGYAIEKGDKSRSTPNAGNGFEYPGEAEFYGSEALWQANADCLWANSELMLTLKQQGKLGFPMLRKHAHLFCNAAGMNYIQSVWFSLRCAMRDFRLFMKYGFD